MQAAGKATQDASRLVTTVPTPYEYALMSRLAYYNLSSLTTKENEQEIRYYEYLKAKGWEQVQTIQENEYYGYIWINKNTEQVVIAHRGSQNATSWITDVESVVRLKPGTFVRSAMDALAHPTVLEYRKQGYRLSSTGHSLGGFLAQVCVFWSHRREYAETFYPNISAVVFDSPGAVDFLEAIRSNLKSEENSIKLEALNVHNFCAMPTLVSTYGTQTGTVWHLAGAEGVKFAFVNDHRMVNILKGFDEGTGRPSSYRQMTDWPQADYSAYENFSGTVEHLAVEAVKIPFTFLNYIYKRYIKRNPTDTWYDKLFRDEGAVSAYLRSQDYRPALETLEEQVSRALKEHYATYQGEAASKTRLAIYHFDEEVQTFLSHLYVAREFGLNKLGIEGRLVEFFGQDQYKLLSQYRLEKYGEKTELVLEPGYTGNVFDFQEQLISLLKQKGIPSIPNLFGTKIEELDRGLSRLEAKQTEEQRKLQEELRQLREVKAKVETEGRVFAVRTAVANKRFTNAIRFLDATDYGPERREDVSRMMREAKPGDKTYIDSAVADEEDTNAIVASQKPTAEQIQLLAGLSGLFRAVPPAPQISKPDQNPPAATPSDPNHSGGSQRPVKK